MQTPFMLFLGDVGTSEALLIVVVILVFFGANKIPELARGLGKGIREFKDASTEIRREFENAGQPTPPNYAQQQPKYGAQPQPPAPLPTPPAAGAGPAFEPWTVPAATSVAPTADADFSFEHKNEDPEPHIAPTLPPNLAPEGTKPRQPFIPTSPNPHL
jgi:sec-independent protein translocase protein TatA